MTGKSRHWHFSLLIASVDCVTNIDRDFDQKQRTFTRHFPHVPLNIAVKSQTPPSFKSYDFKYLFV